MAEIDNKDQELEQIFDQLETDFNHFHDGSWDYLGQSPIGKARDAALCLFKQESLKAQIARLTEIFVAIDGETASNEYVFKLANSIEDRISTLEAELKEIEGGKQ